jgi:hypothetical protein
VARRPVSRGPEELSRVLVGLRTSPARDLREGVEAGSLEEVPPVFSHRAASLSEKDLTETADEVLHRLVHPMLTRIQLGKRKPVIVRIMTPLAISCR